MKGQAYLDSTYHYAILTDFYTSQYALFATNLATKAMTNLVLPLNESECDPVAFGVLE